MTNFHWSFSGDVIYSKSIVFQVHVIYRKLDPEHYLNQRKSIVSKLAFMRHQTSVC